jgi:hypothetical protein
MYAVIDWQWELITIKALHQFVWCFSLQIIDPYALVYDAIIDPYGCHLHCIYALGNLPQRCIQLFDAYKKAVHVSMSFR